MSSAIERPFIETRSHNDRPMNGFLSDRDEFSSGIAPKCLIGDGCIRSSISAGYNGMAFMPWVTLPGEKTPDVHRPFHPGPR
ncbi:hypothetical protein AVEN_261285-1 [Araneus ventricosus]|uniref:Uncharacterized protein n=1 Tax=Araneus ventricosus TaxID=182803 RepID=A0A4Y2R576_ARAVE|nr:hypothetical protein AVEN_261285-1 [Araneus ventricosus]